MKIFPTLYKRSNSKDKINQWTIEVDGDSFRTTTGFVDMKMFTGDWTKCIIKNEGKKNSTTPEQQALAEATSIWTKRKDLGYWENILDCDKKVIYSPMLAKDFTKEKVIYPLASSIKLDGIRCIAKSDGLWTRNGKQIISAPHIFESIKHLFMLYPDLILDGELFTNKEGIDFNTIISCVRKIKPTSEDLELSKKYIEYWIYDLPNFDNKNYQYWQRNVILKELLEKENNSQLIFVGYEIVNNNKEVKNKLFEYISKGFEGQILRVLDSYYENKRSKGLLKHKTFQDEEFKIIGYSEGIGKFQGKLATIKVEVDKISVDCTINGTMEYLEELFNIKDTLIGKMASIKYFEKTTDGSLRFPKCINIDRESYE